jgi:hypothetical protein
VRHFRTVDEPAARPEPVPVVPRRRASDWSRELRSLDGGRR